jgi:hypothetical protein
MYYESFLIDGILYEVLSTKPIIDDEVMVGSENIAMYRDSDGIHTIYFDGDTGLHSEVFPSYEELFEAYDKGVFYVKLDSDGARWCDFSGASSLGRK